MPLTDTVIRQSKPPADKPRKLPDGKGLYLLLYSNSRFCLTV